MFSKIKFSLWIAHAHYRKYERCRKSYITDYIYKVIAWLPKVKVYAPGQNFCHSTVTFGLKHHRNYIIMIIAVIKLHWN